jgi:hypothetical protein
MELFMRFVWQIRGEVVSQILCVGMYATVNCNRSLIQWNRMSIALNRFCFMVSVAIPNADMLSHIMIYYITKH